MNGIQNRATGRERSDLAEIKAGLNAAAESALSFIMPAGYMQKREFKCGDVSGREGQSFGFHVDKLLGDDFGAMGTRGYRGVYDVYVAHCGGDQRKAMELGRAFLNMPEADRPKPKGEATTGTRRKVVDSAWIEVSPTEDTPAPNFKTLWPGSFKRSWAYRDQAGNLLFYVARYESPGKNGTRNKSTPAITLGHTGDGRLHWKAKGGRVVLYGLELLASSALRQDREAWIFEGEKTTEAARKLFPDVLCLTWKGGDKSIRHCDFTPLAGYRLRFIADRDDNGVSERAMKLGAELAMKAGALAYALVTMPDSFPDGWDVADRLPEGWTVEMIRARIEGAPWQGPPAPPRPKDTTEGVEPYWPTNARPIGEVRPELSAQVRQAAADQVSIAMRITPGSGKTTEEIAVAMANSGWIIFAEPNHEIALQVVADMGGFGLHLAGRSYEYEPDKYLCEIHEDAEAAHHARLNVREELCKFCPHQFGCRYLGQLDRIGDAMNTRQAGAIVTVHNYYGQDLAKDIDTDKITRIVIDERIDLDKDTNFPADKLDREAFNVTFARKVLDSFDANGWLDLTGFTAEELSEEAEKEGRSVPFRLDADMSFEERRAAIRKHAEQVKLEFRWKFQRLFSTMAREIGQGREVSNQIVLIRDERNSRNAESRDFIHIYSKVNVSDKLAGLPVHYVDGTLDELHARALLGDRAAFVSLDAVRNLNVTQVCNTVFSKNHLIVCDSAKANRQKVYFFLLALGQKHRKILCGMSKACRDVMEPEWSKFVEGMPGAPLVSFIHMNKGRGSNHYQDYDAVVVIGREEPMPRSIEAAARMRFPDNPITPLPNGPDDGPTGPRWPERLQGYTMKDGRKLGVMVPYHPDPFCQSVLEQIREGEIVQIIDRLRGVNRQDAPAVYLLVNIPTEIPVDRLMTWADLQAEAKGKTKWWQDALELGRGVAPLRAQWLVDAGLFPSVSAAQREVSRFLQRLRDGVEGLPEVATYRLTGQRGNESAALIGPGVKDAASILAGHVGELATFNGLEVLPVWEAAAFEPDEPMIQEMAENGRAVALDEPEGIAAIHEALHALNASMAAHASREGLRTWARMAPEPEEIEEPDLGGNMFAPVGQNAAILLK
mgnify:CR=1 FL=1